MFRFRTFWRDIWSYILEIAVAVSTTAANNSEVLDTISLDPQQTSKKLRNLKDDTAYVITIWALTEAGRGAEKVSTEVTIANSGESETTWSAFIRYICVFFRASVSLYQRWHWPLVLSKLIDPAMNQKQSGTHIQFSVNIISHPV